MAKALRERVGKQYTGTQRTRKAVHGECTVELAKWTFPIISLCREPYEAKVSRTGLTGGMGRRTVRQRALCLPSEGNDLYRACGHGTHSHRLAPEPCGDGVSASIRRRWGWRHGMVSICELSINVVMSNKPKMLPGLSQNGTGAGTGSREYPVMDTQRSRRREAPHLCVSTLWNVVSPYRSFRKEAIPQKSPCACSLEC